eukprot:gene5591-6280_t
MVNCVTCKKAFKSRVGKDKNTRCERCAEVWRELQLREDEEGRKEKNRELDLLERELDLKSRQLEMEKQKVTLKETLSSGNSVELTCFYDEQMQEKVRNLLKGAHLALPGPESREKTPKSTDTTYDTEDLPAYRSRTSTFDKNDLVGHRRVRFEPDVNSSPNHKKFSSKADASNLSECRKPRKLPSVEGLRSRLICRHRLEDEGSSFGSGGSVD